MINIWEFFYFIYEWTKLYLIASFSKCLYIKYVSSFSLTFFQCNENMIIWANFIWKVFSIIKILMYFFLIFISDLILNNIAFNIWTLKVIELKTFDLFSILFILFLNLLRILNKMHWFISTYQLQFKDSSCSEWSSISSNNPLHLVFSFFKDLWVLKCYFYLLIGILNHAYNFIRFSKYIWNKRAIRIRITI